MRCFVPLAAVLATVQAGATGPGVFFVLGGQTRPHMAVSGPTHMVKTVHHVLLMDNGGHPMKAVVPDSKPAPAASTPQAVVVPPPLRRAGLAMSGSAPPAVRMPHLYHYQMARYARMPGYNFQPQFQQLPTYLSPTYTQPGGGANSYDMQGLKDLAARFLDPVDFKAISARQEMIDRHKAMLERQREIARQQEMLQRQIEAAEIQQDFDKMDQMLGQITDQAPETQPQVGVSAQESPAAEPQQQQQPEEVPEQQQQQEQHPQPPVQDVHHNPEHHQQSRHHHHQTEHKHEAGQEVSQDEKHREDQQAQHSSQDHQGHQVPGIAQHQEDHHHQTPIQAIAGHPQQVPSRFHRYQQRLHHQQQQRQQQQQQQHYPQQYHDQQQYHQEAPQSFHQRQRRHHEQGPQVASTDVAAVWKNRHQHQVLRHVADGLHVIHDGERPQNHHQQQQQQQVPAHQDEQPHESQTRVTIKEQVAASEVHETILKGKRRLTARLRLKERVPSSASAMFWI